MNFIDGKFFIFQVSFFLQRARPVHMAHRDWQIGSLFYLSPASENTSVLKKKKKELSKFCNEVLFQMDSTFGRL